MWKEFKAFALKGNVVDLAVGVIIGAAFGKIVSSAVSDIIMPLIGLLTGAKNFNNFFLMLKKPPVGSVITTIDEAKALNIPTLNYGVFITNVVDFLIVAFFIFLVIKAIVKLKEAPVKRFIKIKGQEPIEVVAEIPTTKECPYCKSTIHINATRCPSCTSVIEDIK